MQLSTQYKVSKNNIHIIICKNRTKRLFTYEYILNKRVKEFQKELCKDDNSISMIILLKKIIANEKISIPRLKIFEKLVPSYLE